MTWIKTTLVVSLFLLSFQTFADINEPMQVGVQLTNPNWGDAFEKLVGRIRFLRMVSEGKALESYMKAWNDTHGTNPQDIINHFANNKTLAFRDILSKGVIADKANLKNYLDRLYTRFPKQKWGIDARAYPSMKTPGEWAVYNRFELYDHVSDQKPSFTGTGMDLFRFANDGSGKLIVDEVHVNIDGLDISDLVGFKD